MASEVHFVPLKCLLFFFFLSTQTRYSFLEFSFLLWDRNETKLFEQMVTFAVMRVDIRIEGLASGESCAMSCLVLPGHCRLTKWRGIYRQRDHQHRHHHRPQLSSSFLS